MSKGSHVFRQRDLTRAIRAAKAAGWDKPVIVIDPKGQITLRCAEDSEMEIKRVNEWAGVQ